MLRYDYMPSDFDPLYLFLGDEHDLAKLAELLRTFSGEPRATKLDDRIPGGISRAPLTLVPVPEGGDAGEYGVRANGDGSFRWALNAWQAEQIADRIDALTPPDNKSGSDIFELGVEGEIPVKVSRGEFTDDFLIQTF